MNSKNQHGNICSSSTGIKLPVTLYKHLKATLLPGVWLLAVVFCPMMSEAAYMQMDDEWINDLIAQMTLKEKVSMVHGAPGEDSQGRAFVGYMPGIPRLSIPPMGLQNGGSGAGATFSVDRHKAPATAFPTAIAQAATWDMDLLYKVGRVIGIETRGQGRSVMLGPMINIIRAPEGGRNFELFSEDPYLSARCSVNVINGIQDVGTLANAKVMIANNQETWRHTVDARISERALREVYMLSFEAAVKEAEVASIMTAYNKVNGIYCSEHPLLLKQMTKTEWGFKGFIMTDWGTWHETVPAVKAGLDLEMSGWGKFGEPKFMPELEDAVLDGKVEEAELDEMVYRILREMKRFGLIGNENQEEYPEAVLDAPEHRKLAWQTAVEAAVLLKNANGVLPLDADKTTKLALFGDADIAVITGGGSSKVVPFYNVPPLEGLSNRLENAEVVHYRNIEDAQPADAAMIFITRDSTETRDRESISLEAETALIQAVSEKYETTIVVLRTPGAYILPWLEDVDAVLQMWFAGQEEGNAEAALLFGDANPSGKLPVTFGRRRSDFPAARSREFPGVDRVAEYSEGVFVGYRYFEKEGHIPLFPFGYGLSYTTFEYDNLELSAKQMQRGETLTVTYQVKNTGPVAGAEVAQMYIQDIHASVERPLKELKGFDKVFLEPGESATIEHTIRFRDLAFWDEVKGRWKAETGRFNVLIGSSSQMIELSEAFKYFDRADPYESYDDPADL